MIKKSISKNLALLIVLANISICSYSCSIIGHCVEGQGKIVEESLQLENFSKIELFGSSKVYLKQGEPQSVIIKAQSNLIDILNQEVSDKEWEIKFSECIEPAGQIEIFITLPFIEEIEIEGSGEVVSQEILNCDKLELEINGSGEITLTVKAENLESDISGSGDINLTGLTNTHDISIKGSGDISAFDLISNRTDIEIKGSGNVKVNTNTSLDVEIFGSGDVYYKGDAQYISSEIKGSGNLSKKK